MKWLPFALLVLAFGCSVPRSIPEGGVVAGQTIAPTGKVLILSIADGQEAGQPVANGSGRGMVAALRKVLMAHSVPFTTTETRSNVDGFTEAEKLAYDYVMKCTITLWENNATAWSGNGDKLKISVEMFDVKTKQLAGVAGFYRVATGFTLVAGTPDRMMDECAEGALAKLYGWPAK